MRYQLLLFLSLIVTITSAQSDELGMRFQAVARDADGAVIANESLTTRVELLLAGQNDIVLYREFHDVETNRYGLISLTIGEGVPTFGAFADIPWEERNIWTRISIKRAADPDFSVVSTSRLLSVPYAQYAEKAGSVTGFDQGSGQFSLGPGESTEWSVHGNANTNKFTDDPKLGPLDENSLKIITNREERIFIDSDGSTFIHGPTTIGGPDTTATFFTGDVVMKGGLSVSEDAEFLGETTFGGAGQSTTTFLGNVQVNNDINVDGNSTLNGITTIGGPEMNNALFTGAVSVNKGLSVDSSTFLNGSTFIGGVDMNPTRILGDLQVNKDLAIGGKVRVLDTLDVFGRTTFTIDVDGEQTDQSSYPVLIRGSKQGLAIDLVPATDNILISNRGNNYISFWRNGEQKGRIEGMGRADLDPTGLTNLIVQLVSDPPSSISTPGIVGGDYLPFSVGNPENIVGLIDFDPGGLPNLINNLSFDPGSLPSLSFDPLSLDPGSLPSLTTSIPFDPGILPSVDFSGLEGFIQFQNPFEGGGF